MNAKLLHGKNVANFEILISFLISIEDKYNPLDNELKISHLQKLLREAEKSIQIVRFYRIINENIYHTINIQLIEIKELYNKIVEVLEFSDISTKVINEAKKLNSIVQNESIKNITEIEKYSQTQVEDNYLKCLLYSIPKFIFITNASN